MPSRRFKKPRIDEVSTSLSGELLDRRDAGDDYMSALHVINTGPPKHVEARVKQRPKKIVELMTERREEALDSKIGEENVGFRMLCKMGFRDGSGLGREGKGVLAPLRPVSHAGRSGLGRVEEVREKKMQKAKSHDYAQRQCAQTFQSYLSSKFESQKLWKLLSKASQAIQHLDELAGIPRGELWPEIEDEVAHPDESGVGGVQSFEDASGQEHFRDRLAHTDDTAPVETEKCELSSDEILEKLKESVNYLRSTHQYSLANSCSYEDLGRQLTEDEELGSLMEE
uniref:G-patch domain-containing protein n=1 Tax=Octactis speculum TaxID=3111310 RepID=A0A7S2HHP6_9STRA|mmetsp:Transcript_65017/g.89354  ORF Transcript_65017/g.89354 Transcript_65017/m.89354 type:complete len:284 (+) Transcript_65017:51-902(+)